MPNSCSTSWWTWPVGARTCARMPSCVACCRAQIEALGRMDDPDFTLTPEGIADGLERKGVVCRDEDGRCVVPIPSMVTWAQEQLRGP